MLPPARAHAHHGHQRTPPLAPRPVTRRSCTSRLVAVGMHGRPMSSEKPQQQTPGSGSTPPAIILHAHGQLAPPGQSNISQRGASRCRCTAPRGLAHAKPFDPGQRQAPRTGPTASPSTRVFAKHLEPGPRQAPRSTPSHCTTPTERATQQAGGAWHAPALFCCSPSGDANGV